MLLYKCNKFKLSKKSLMTIDYTQFNVTFKIKLNRKKLTLLLLLCKIIKYSIYYTTS